MNIQELKNKLELSNHFIERFSKRFDYSKLTKDEKRLSLKQKVKLLIDKRIDFYRNTDGAYSVWLDSEQELIIAQKGERFIAITLKTKSNVCRHDYIYKKLVQLDQARANKFYRTTNKRKVSNETFWNI